VASLTLVIYKNMSTLASLSYSKAFEYPVVTWRSQIRWCNHLPENPQSCL